MNPLIRWAGSKRALLPTLRKYWPRNARYIEPFCGSGCLFFDLEPSKAVLGDINKDLINTYRALRHDAGRVLECLLRFRKTKETYYKLRRVRPDDLSDCEAAARFLFLNRFSFNGIYRTNLKGEFNVPYGPPKDGARTKFDPDTFIAASRLLQNTVLIEGDFEQTISNAERGDFIYLDPPYAVSNRRIFAEYHPESFGVKDLSRLGSLLADLDQRGVKFLVSYADSKEGRELLKKWNPKRIQARRNVAGFVGDRRIAYEVLASNMEPIQ